MEKRAFLLIAATFIIYLYSNNLRISSAVDLKKAAGPSEYSIGLRYGFNPRCGFTFISVGFWQQGPGIPERQGYICDGVFSPATMKIVPFEEGLILEDLT